VDLRTLAVTAVHGVPAEDKSTLLGSAPARWRSPSELPTLSSDLPQVSELGLPICSPARSPRMLNARRIGCRRRARPIRMVPRFGAGSTRRRTVQASSRPARADEGAVSDHDAHQTQKEDSKQKTRATAQRGALRVMSVLAALLAFAPGSLPSLGPAHARTSASDSCQDAATVFALSV